MNRALGMAAVLLMVAGWTAIPARAQNLEAGKSPSQIFSGTCAACHRSPRGLLRTVPPGSLPGFLREHYTTGRDMATLLSGYLISNGATDPRGGGTLTRQGQESRSAPKPAVAEQEPPAPGRRPRPGQPQQSGQSDPSAPEVQGDPRRRRDSRGPDRQAPAATAPATSTSAVATDPAAERAKQKLSKRGKRGREALPPSPVDAARETGREALPLGDAVKTNLATPDPAKAEPGAADADSSAAAPSVDANPSGNSASGEPADTTSRLDPVPQVTPAPTRPAHSETPPAGSAQAPAPEATPPAPLSALPAPAPQGPPAPPISQ